MPSWAILALAFDEWPSHRRLNWRQHLFDRGTWEDWEAAGRPELQARRAREHVQALLASHEAPALPDGQPAELDRIVASFAREAGVG